MKKFSKYLIELVVIVVGITLSFLVDEWREEAEHKLDYIHQNPVEARIIDEPEHYVYSSARDYAGSKGMIAIKFIR